jgi:hypothetical protein
MIASLLRQKRKTLSVLIFISIFSNINTKADTLFSTNTFPFYAWIGEMYSQPVKARTYGSRFHVGNQPIQINQLGIPAYSTNGIGNVSFEVYVLSSLVSG